MHAPMAGRNLNGAGRQGMTRGDLLKLVPEGDGAASAGHLGDLLRVLPADLRSEIEGICHTRRVPAHHVLVEDGDEPDHIGYVIAGTLCMAKLLPDGRRHIIGLLVPTDMYGRIYDGRTSYRIETLTEAEIVVFERPAFERILSAAPEAERLFIVNVLDELDAAREWILVLAGPRAVQRVASFLLILARRKLRERRIEAKANAQVSAVEVAISRTDLAHYLGTRPETLSRSLHELQSQGVIRIQTSYVFDMLDLRALTEASGQDLVIDG